MIWHLLDKLVRLLPRLWVLFMDYSVLMGGTGGWLSFRPLFVIRYPFQVANCKER